jgi:hypothetical protein
MLTYIKKINLKKLCTVIIEILKGKKKQKTLSLFIKLLKALMTLYYYYFDIIHICIAFRIFINVNRNLLII